MLFAFAKRNDNIVRRYSCFCEYWTNRKLGIVREITGKARNRIYRADEILTALAQPTLPAPPEPRSEKTTGGKSAP